MNRRRFLRSALALGGRDAEVSTCSWCAGSRRDPVMGAGPCRGCDGGGGMTVQWALLIGLVAFLLFVLIFGFRAVNL